MCDDIDLELGRRLRRRRRLLGVTQESLGAQVGVRFQQIQKYECAQNRMSAAMLAKLAGALDVSVASFFEGINGQGRDASSHRRRSTSDGHGEFRFRDGGT